LLIRCAALNHNAMDDMPVRDVAWCRRLHCAALVSGFFDGYFGGKKLSVRNALFVFRHPWLPVLVSTGWDGQLQQVRVAALRCSGA
jgi:hypothetical protein